VTDLLVGIDVGTTSCKAAVLSLQGAEIAHAKRPTPWTPVPTGAEIDGPALVRAASGAVEDALERAPRGRVLGVGVCSLGETGFLLDGEGNALGPGVAWHDSRGEEQAESMKAALGHDDFVIRTGLPVSSAWTIAKVRALVDAGLDAASGGTWLSVAEYVVHALGGDRVAEPSLASRTGLFDVRTMRWWDEAIEWAGTPRRLFPQVAPAGTAAGRVSGAGSLAGAVLTVGGHDHPCAAVGAGALAEGDVLNSCGTAEAVLRAVSRPFEDSEVKEAVGRGLTLGRHAIPGRRAVFGFFKAGFALSRFLGLLGVEQVGEARLALDEAALKTPGGAGGMEALDVSTGRAALTGIGIDASPGLAWRAALEAAARETAGLLRLVGGIAGAPERVVVAGGWARSRAYLEVKRAAIGPFELPAVSEAGARGAGLLAGVAAGVYDGVSGVPVPELSDG
jgi:sugar (pentulose or hexulose) kinase